MGDASEKIDCGLSRIDERCDDPFDRVVGWMLSLLLLFGPLSLGAVQAWSEAVFDAIALTSMAVVTLKWCRRPAVRIVRTWATLPIAVFLAICCVQLFDLPRWMVRGVSPNTVELTSRLLGDAPDAAGQSSTLSLSFYREATWHDLRALVAIVCVFYATLNSTRRLDQIRRLLRTIAIIGGAFAALSLVQIATDTRDIFWLIPTPDGRAARSGSFINHSHFGQWMNLSIGAAIALLLDHLSRHFRRNDYTAEEVVAKLRQPALRSALWLVAMIVFSAAAVALSLSRGAMVGIAMGTCVIAAATLLRRGASGRGWIFAALAIVVLGIALLDYSVLMRRFTGDSARTMQGNRLQIVRDLIPVWKQFPLVGTGLGTYSRIFPMFDRSTFAYFATHAENEYAQLVTETGLIGLACIALFIGIVSAAWWSSVRNNRSQNASRRSPAKALALGLGFGWIAILIHSVTDFGQHIDAIAGLTAVTTALLLNLAALHRVGHQNRNAFAMAATDLARRRIIAVASLATILLIALATLTQAVDVWRAEEAWTIVRRIDADLQHRDWLADNAEYADILQAASSAARLRPGNVEYQFWLNFYRWKSLERSRDANSGAVVLTSEANRTARRIVDELLAARWSCCTYGPLPLLAGQLQMNFIPDLLNDGYANLKLAYELNGPDPQAALIFGEASARRGEASDAAAALSRATELDPTLAPVVVTVFVNPLNRPDLAMLAAGNNPDALDALATTLTARGEAEPVAIEARQRAMRVRQSRADSGDASTDELVALAKALSQLGNDAGATTYLAKAVARDSDRIDVRLALAESLFRTGRFEDAQKQAHRVVQAQPGNMAALSLLGRVALPSPASLPAATP